ncbi:ABC transporter permease [Gulosibacter sp. ACHW.36C]|uniref:ABC transporter permease n=1 Tax=Gulosibacter sediminis TaxID=1729695 RepID=A0ABY4MVW0_9MICO|nr:ABC transporter permease [Gulosibacter sediminis]UQN13934.1 ABC transporter permease [Gulosibacter sediminis]
MNWVANNLDLIGQLTFVHARQSLVALALGFVLSLPIGWAAWRVRWLRGLLTGVTGLLYTVPSLALLVILPVIAGYPAASEANLVVALTLYALAILVRTVVDALDSVDGDVRQAADALGFGGLRRFFAVDLRLAVPVLLAGLRVTAVSTVALATVGILVGVENLGYLFTNGLQRRIIAEVFAGVLAVVIIALVIDLALQLLGRVLTPWLHATTRRARVEGRAA